MRSIKFYLILLFAICTFAVNAQIPQGYPANYANGPRFKALIYYTNMQKKHIINSPCRQ